MNLHEGIRVVNLVHATRLTAESKTRFLDGEAKQNPDWQFKTWPVRFMSQQGKGFQKENDRFPICSVYVTGERASSPPLLALDSRAVALKTKIAIDLYSRAAAVIRAYGSEAGDDQSVGICNCSDIALADELDSAATSESKQPN